MEKSPQRTKLVSLLTRSIRTRIWLSAALCLIAVGIVATSRSQIMQDTAELPRVLYEQPYTVGLAVRDLKADVAVMRSELSDLARSPSRLALRRFEQRMREIDERASRLQATISDRFVGDPDSVASAFAAHVAWNVVREQVTTAIRSGDQVTAYTLMKTEGYNQLKALDESLEHLIAKANEHSLKLYGDAKRYVATAKEHATAALFTAIVILGFAGLVIHSIVVKPIREISSAIQNVSSGNLETDIPHAERIDEIGLIAKSCRIFLNHAISIQKSSIDLLTGLPKRHQLLEQISARERNELSIKENSFLLHVDIDDFTEVNDGSGREVGDALLVHAADMLRNLTKSGDCVAREGADSFLFYRPDSTGEDEAIQLAETLQTALEAPMQYGEMSLPAQCSIGIATGDAEVDAEAILSRAGHALLEAKRCSKRSISIYTPEMDARLLRRRETLRGLRFALEHDEIVPFFQPQVDTRSGELIGFECLVRWSHPEHGVMTPWQFLPVARNAGLLRDITETMISKSAKQLAAWRAAGFTVPRISLNLDASDLERDDFVDRLQLEIDKFGLSPSDVCLELLETAMLEDGENPVSQALTRLGQLGFPLELDDFGTGHAAIASLRLVALHGIKIDRSFVTKLHERPGQMKLTRAMLRLAHALQIQTVAEGVETAAERKLLLELGCDTIQGFGIGKPMSADDASLWLEAFSPSIGRMDKKIAA